MYREVGMFAWLMQRLSALMLIVFGGLKLYTGYAAVGKLPGQKWAMRWHFGPQAAWIDIPLLIAVLIHTVYGLRVILTDLGLRREKATFWAASAVAGLTFVVALGIIYL